MADRTALTRVKYEQLKAECERLRRDVDELRDLVQQQRRELETQFVRIAEMHAILDAEHLQDRRQPSAPLYRRS